MEDEPCGLGRYAVLHTTQFHGAPFCAEDKQPTLAPSQLTLYLGFNHSNKCLSPAENGVLALLNDFNTTSRILSVLPMTMHPY
jgi:hypothetical protein